MSTRGTFCSASTRWSKATLQQGGDDTWTGRGEDDIATWTGAGLRERTMSSSWRRPWRVAPLAPVRRASRFPPTQTASAGARPCRWTRCYPPLTGDDEKEPYGGCIPLLSAVELELMATGPSIRRGRVLVAASPPNLPSPPWAGHRAALGA